MTEDKFKDLTIVKGKKSEAKIAAVLMNMAFGPFSQHLFGTENSKTILHYFAKLWKKNNNSMSYKYSYIVHNSKDEPIALISCSPGKFVNRMFLPSFWEVVTTAPRLIRYIFNHLNYLYALLTSPETRNDEYYIFMLAVLPEQQNKGIGSWLLEFAERKAKDENFSKLSLLVRIENVNAIRFYERFGFKKVATYNKYPMNFYKLVKTI